MTLWIAGWLFMCGVASKDPERNRNRSLTFWVTVYLSLAVLWPLCLGAWVVTSIRSLHPR